MSDDPWRSRESTSLDFALIEQLRRGPAKDWGDLELIPALARFVHNEFEMHASGSDDAWTDEHELRTAVLALQATAARLSIVFNPPFRDAATFGRYWRGSNTSESRSDALHRIFEPLHEDVTQLEIKLFASQVAEPISPRQVTGWAQVDREIGELRRHFAAARTGPDHRNVGNDCVVVLEMLSRQVYRPDVHLNEGEAEPPVGDTKRRLSRYVEVAAEGSDQAELRGLVRAAIVFAQRVKHNPHSTRQDAGISADAVVLLAHVLRRLDGPS